MPPLLVHATPGPETEMPEAAQRTAAGFMFVDAKVSAGGAIVLRNHLGHASLLDPNNIGFPREARNCTLLGSLWGCLSRQFERGRPPGPL